MASTSDAIRVGIRARPFFTKEQGQKRPWNTNETSLVPAEGGEGSENTGSQYNFDHFWPEDLPNGAHTIHQDFTKSVVESVLQGFNGTVCAYGQTGTGKTYTMAGDAAAGVKGVCNYCLEQLFGHIASSTTHEYVVRVMYIEIYNEVVRDLLNPKSKPLKVRHSKDIGFYVDDVKEIVVAEPLGLRSR